MKNQRMAGIDLLTTLRNCLQAINPIARERKITISLKDSPEPCFTTLPTDEVLGSVFFLLLRLMYVLPENRELKVKALKRFDPAVQAWFLKVEIRLFNMHINPNLIFKPNNNRFKLEHLTDKNTRIYIEWQIQDASEKLATLPCAI